MAKQKTPSQGVLRQKAEKQASRAKSKIGQPKQSNTKQTSLTIAPTKASVSLSVPAVDYSNRLTPSNMLGDPFVFTAIKVLSESIASTPLEIYSKTTLTKATDFYLYRFLKRSMNEEQTPYEVLSWLLIDFYRYGYCIAACPRDDEGKVIGIYPLPADQIKAFRVEDSGELFYTYGDFVFEQNEIFKAVNFFDRGLFGSSILDYQRNTLGTSAATSAFAAQSFAKGCFPSGIGIPEDNTTLEEMQELKARFREEYGGFQNSGAVILSQSLKDFKQFSISNEDSQMVESRKFDRSVIAGLFRVPAHLINDLEKATFSNIEHLDLDFIKHTLRPLAKNLEQRLALVLLNDVEAEQYDISFNFDALARGDLASRTAALNTQIQCGLRTLNEARELENLPPVDGGNTPKQNAAIQNIN